MGSGGSKPDSPPSAANGLFAVLKSFGGRRRSGAGDVLQSPPPVARAPAPAPPPIAEAAALTVRFARLRGPLAAAACARSLGVSLVVDVFSPPGPGARGYLAQLLARPARAYALGMAAASALAHARARRCSRCGEARAAVRRRAATTAARCPPSHPAPTFRRRAQWPRRQRPPPAPTLTLLSPRTARH